MGEYFPLLFAGGLIGVFSLLFIFAYWKLKHQKEAIGFDRHMADSEIIRRLAKYALPYKKDFILVLVIMLISIVYDLVSPLLVGYIEELVSGDFALSQLFITVAVYAGILLVSLVCTYL